MQHSKCKMLKVYRMQKTTWLQVLYKDYVYSFELYTNIFLQVTPFVYFSVIEFKRVEANYMLRFI